MGHMYKLPLIALLIAMCGCTPTHPLVGRKLEFTERTETTGCKEAHQAIELTELTSSISFAGDPGVGLDELKKASEYLEQLTRTGQARKLEWTTTATIVEVTLHTLQNGESIQLLKLDSGYWIPHWPDGSHGHLNLID